MRKRAFILLILFLVACSPPAVSAALPAPTDVPPTATMITTTPRPTQTLEPYEQYTIDYLRQRAYGGGRIEVVEKLAETDLYNSYSIHYPSDGLQIYGFINIPKGSRPFPVIVSIHGYAPSGAYNVFSPEADFADIFAQNQFIVIHPGLRNQPPSDSGDNLFRVGMSVDVLNLIAMLKDHKNLPSELRSANPNLLGLWGTSLGGEIALRVLTISPDVKAAVLYSPLSGDSVRNSRQLYKVLEDNQFQLDDQVPLEWMDRISPMNYFYRITSAIQIDHGTADTTAPISWTVETCDFMKAANISVQCIYYPGAGHRFSGTDEDSLRSRALDFYRQHLRP